MSKTTDALEAVKAAILELGGQKEQRTADEIIADAHAPVDTAGLGLAATPAVLTPDVLRAATAAIDKATSDRDMQIRALTVIALALTGL